MKRRLLLLVILSLGGCSPAASVTSRSTTPAATAVPAERVGREERAALELERERNRELAAQLGLARAESDDLREEIASLRREARSETTRIQRPPNCEASAAPADEAPAEAPEERESASASPRPVLRLYGTGPSTRPAASPGASALPGPAAPAFVAPPPPASVRLPVFASASDPEAGVPAIPPSPVTVMGDSAPAPVYEPAAPLPRPAPAPDAAAIEYRAALRHLAERRIGQAAAGLDSFLQEHGGHPYADNAMYWRAEIEYTQRNYREALTRFSQVIERYPRGNKVPDALLRIGLCYERLGQRARARRVFSRLREQYPNTVAARLASREDA